MLLNYHSESPASRRGNNEWQHLVMATPKKSKQKEEKYEARSSDVTPSSFLGTSALRKAKRLH